MMKLFISQLLITLIVLNILIPGSAYAQTSNPSPTYYCGGSSYCVSTAPTPTVYNNTTPNPSVTEVVDTVTVNPTSDPCNPTASVTARHKRHSKGRSGGSNGFFSQFLQFLIQLINLLLKQLGGDFQIPVLPGPRISVTPGVSIYPTSALPTGISIAPTNDPCIPSATTNPSITSTVSNIPTNGVLPTTPASNGFPYPRGTAPAYGFMACSNLQDCKSLGATLIHPKYSNSISVAEFVDFVNQAKSLGIQNYFINTMAPEGNSDSFWQGVKDAGITDNDFLGVYFPDEPRSPSEISTMYTSMKKYFPKALAGDYGIENEASSYTQYLDIAYFTTYTKFHDRPSNFPYTNLIENGPAWKSAGKTIWETTETFGAACTVTSSDPDLSSAQLVSDRQIAQIVMGILGGAQGVFPYAGTYAKGTPCETGWSSFKPKYTEIWPWIMQGNRTLLTTNVTSGTTNASGSTAVVSYLFKDASNKTLIGTSSMLDVTEANNTANGASITGVPNGTYTVLWENRSVSVSNGSLTDTWKPYQFHFYQLQ